MKKINIIPFLLCMLAILPACEKDDVATGSIVTTVPVMNTLTQLNYELTEPSESENPFQFRLTWSKAKFLYEAGDIAYVNNVMYEVEACLTNDAFAHPVVLATTDKLFFDLNTIELNQFISGVAGVTNETIQNVSVRVKTTYNDGISELSESISFTVKPYVHKYIVISPLANSGYSLIEPEGDANPVAFNLTWTPANYDVVMGLSEPKTYVIEADLAANNFEKAVQLASMENLSTDLTTKELNAAILGLAGATNEAAQNVTFRIKVVYSNGATEYSDPITVAITPYVHKDFPSNIYLIGNMNGWDNTNTDYIMFRDNNNASDGVYVYTGYFATECYLKFCADENMGSWDNLYYAGADGLLIKGASDGGAFYAAAGKYYTFTIDVKNMTWLQEEYASENVKSFTTLGPIGGFCGWDNEPAMTQSTFDTHQWHLEYTFADETAVKFRGDKDWANNWGGTGTELPFGKAIFDGPGANVKAGTYDIYFNDLTGHYVITK